MYVAALVNRLRVLGIRGVRLAETEGEREQFAVAGAKFSLFLTSHHGPLLEIDFALSEPSNDADLEKLMSAVAYTLRPP